MLGDDMLAAAAGLANGRGLGDPASAAPGQAQPRRPHRLVAGQRRLLLRSRQRGGDKVGPNPIDRGKPGSKRHLLVDRAGLPLAVLLTAANLHDSKALNDLVDAVRPVRQRRGRPRRRPHKLHADKGYDYPRCRRDLRARGIVPRIARRGIETSQRLGRHRWVVERSFAWLNRARRLIIRYERHADLYLAFLILACALICFRALQAELC